MPREWILSSLCWVKTWSIFRWAWSSISTWINATKQAAKDKTIDEKTRGLLIGRLFVSISTTQSIVVIRVLKPVKTCSQTVELELTLERSYGCCSLKGCVFADESCLGPSFWPCFRLLILAVFQVAEEAFCVNVLNLFIQWTKGGYSLRIIRYLTYIKFIILTLNFFLFSFVSVVTQSRVCWVKYSTALGIQSTKVRHLG